MTIAITIQSNGGCRDVVMLPQIVRYSLVLAFNCGRYER